MVLVEWGHRPPTVRAFPQNLAVDLADTRNRRLQGVRDSGQFGAVRVAALVGQPQAQTQTQLAERAGQQDRP